MRVILKNNNCYCIWWSGGCILIGLNEGVDPGGGGGREREGQWSTECFEHMYCDEKHNDVCFVMGVL